MHGLVTLFLEVIALAIILLVVGLAVPRVLVAESTAIMALRPVLTANALFLSPKLSYVLFILARDHLGKLVFAGDGKISFEICSTLFDPIPNIFFFEICSTYWVTVKIGINGLSPDLYRNKHRITPE